MMRALHHERARLRRLRRGIVTVLAALGAGPALMATLPSSTAVRTLGLPWASVAVLLLLVAAEELLLVFDQHRLTAHVALGTAQCNPADCEMRSGLRAEHTKPAMGAPLPRPRRWHDQ